MRKPPFVDLPGPLTWHEARDFRRFLLRPATIYSLADFGADTAIQMLEVRGAFGCAIPTAIRRGWWQRLAWAGCFASARANPEAPAMQTAEGRASTERELESALARWAAFHDARLMPLIASAPEWLRPEAGNITHVSRRRESDDEPPPGAA